VRIAVAVVAGEARIVVVLLDVILRHVVVVLAAGSDLVGQVADRDIGITPNPPVVGDGAVVPMVTPGDGLEIEWVRRCHREDIADACIIGDPERRSPVPTEHLHPLAAPDPVVLPGIEREEQPEAPIGVDSHHSHVGVHLGDQVHMRVIATLVRRLGVE